MRAKPLHHRDLRMRARERYLDAVGFARRLAKVGEERRASLLDQDLSEAERLRGDMSKLEGMRVDLGDRRVVLNKRIEALTQVAARLLRKEY